MNENERYCTHCRELRDCDVRPKDGINWMVCRECGNEIDIKWDKNEEV